MLASTHRRFRTNYLHLSGAITPLTIRSPLGTYYCVIFVFFILFFTSPKLSSVVKTPNKNKLKCASIDDTVPSCRSVSISNSKRRACGLWDWLSGGGVRGNDENKTCDAKPKAERWRVKLSNKLLLSSADGYVLNVDCCFLMLKSSTGGFSLPTADFRASNTTIHSNKRLTTRTCV